MALPRALTILTLLAAMALTVHLLSRQTYKGLGKIDGFLRAVAVGEACYTRTIARLEGAAWEHRWFRGKPSYDEGTWGGGSYQSVIGEGSKPLQAELLVRARSDENQVLLYWRLTADVSTLSPYRRMRTSLFSYQDPLTPMTAAGLGAITALVDQAAATREKNRPWEAATEAKLLGDPQPGNLPPALGLTLPPPPSVIPPPVDGGASTPLTGRTGPVSDPSVPMPPLPPPVAGPLPATGQQIVDLANLKAALAKDADGLGRASNYMYGAIGAADTPGNTKGGYVDSSGIKQPSKLVQIQNAVNAAASACPCPPTTSSAPNCATAICPCVATMANLSQQAATMLAGLEGEAQGCQDQIDQLNNDIAAAAQPPGPTQAQAQALLDRGQGITTCVSNFATAVQAQVSTLATSASACGPTGGAPANQLLDPPVQ